MTISIGDRMPDGKLGHMGENGPEQISTDELFSGRKVVLFAVPGAFTPTCAMKHLPGFIDQVDAIRARGVDVIACLAVNDVFVMSAWGKASHADDKVLMLADGNADYTRLLGLDVDATAYGMGIRSRRYSILVDDGVVRQLNVDAPGEFSVSSAESLLEQLG
jgi:glutaredoxin/glutathione-dependent peroxiredoxin